MTTYLEVKGMKGETYMLNQSPEAIYKADLESHPARLLYDLMKIQQPEPFLQMAKEQTLITSLNKLAETYMGKMEEHISNGWTEAEAMEAEWWNLTVTAGLEKPPMRELPIFPPR